MTTDTCKCMIIQWTFDCSTLLYTDVNIIKYRDVSGYSYKIRYVRDSSLWFGKIHF